MKGIQMANVGAAWGAAFALSLAQGAAAAEISVLSGGAIEPGLRAAASAFEKQTRDTVKITFNTTPQIRKRIDAGEKFDVVIAPPAAMDAFAKAGKISEERVGVGRVGMGVAVRPGAPVPDISSAEALRRSVLEAETLVFNRASSGLYFEGLLKKLGVYEQIEGKTTRYADAGSVMEHLLKGKGREIGFGPVTEILMYKEKGLRFVGPLPAEAQNYTSYEAARGLVRFLGSPSGKALFVAAGVE
jgi:molybdate transport system substrate-binding protein